MKLSSCGFENEDRLVRGWVGAILIMVVSLYNDFSCVETCIFSEGDQDLILWVGHGSNLHSPMVPSSPCGLCGVCMILHVHVDSAQKLY